MTLQAAARNPGPGALTTVQRRWVAAPASAAARAQVTLGRDGGERRASALAASTAWRRDADAPDFQRPGREAPKPRGTKRRAAPQAVAAREADGARPPASTQAAPHARRCAGALCRTCAAEPSAARHAEGSVI